jgi:hypothetical protein
MTVSLRWFSVVLLGVLMSLGCCQELFAQTTDERLVDSLVKVAQQMERPDSSRIAGKDSTGIAPDTIARRSEMKPEKNFLLKGFVRDKGTGEGIPFASVFFPGSDIGVSAELDGSFELKFTKQPNDTLRITAIGYGTINRIIRFGSKEQMEMVIEMNRAASALEEFVFHGGEDPALILLKKIIEAKPRNDQDQLPSYKNRVYNKLEVDIRNLSRKQFESLPVPMIKEFGFIYENLDTVSEPKPFLPFFLIETLSDYYYQKNPKRTQELIRATQVKGIRNESIDQFLGSNYQNVNAYNNFIPVFDKSFVSPIAANAAFYYKYRIKDTQMAYGHPVILVEFRPRRDGENCFYGDFWVVDSVYAIQRISLQVPKNANLNFVTRVDVYQESAPVNDSLWFIVKDKFIADFHLPYSPRLPGFTGRKTTYYQDIVPNSPEVAEVLRNPEYKKDVVVADTARQQNEAFWSAVRPDTLNKNEQAIYSMMDSLDGMLLFQRFKRTLKFLFGGYVTVGPVDIGPYYNVYSHNYVEGDRFRMGLATNQDLWKDLRLSGYVAYGTLDQRFKYYLDGFWLTNRKQRTYLFASYRDDIDRSNNYYDNSITADNIFANIGRKPGVIYKMAHVHDARFEYYQEHYNGFSHAITLQHRSFDPYDPLPYVGIFLDDEGHQQNEVINSDVGVKFRYAYKEQFVESHYFRQSLGSKYPIVELRANFGVKNVLGSGYEYQKLFLSISDNVKIAPLGSIYWNVYGGKIFGNLPYPLLEIHPGNEFYYYNRQAFSLMTRYEYISDQFAGFNFEHNVGGGIFNYIPYLKKARLRQFWTAKGVIGSLNDANSALNLGKGYPFRTLERNPYLEVGTGVENILQLFRIDFVWRVLPEPFEREEKWRYFGIFGSVRFKF